MTLIVGCIFFVSGFFFGKAYKEWRLLKDFKTMRSEIESIRRELNKLYGERIG